MKQHTLFGRFIRYAPSVLLVSTALKIYFLSIAETAFSPTNAVNLVLNMLMLWMVYVQGVTLGFCWKHRSLCRIVAWEYAYYATIEFAAPKYELISMIVNYNLVIVPLILLYYLMKK